MSDEGGKQDKGGALAGGASRGAAEAGSGADDYQAKYMAGGALYHDKIRAPLAYHLIFLLPLSIVLASSLFAFAKAGAAALIAPAFSLVLLPIIWLLFSVLRISVTRDEVYVQYGLFGPKIKVRDIESARAVSYDWKKYGGWGIRYGGDGSVAYNMMGDHGRAVEILHRKGSKTKKLLLASPDPEKLAAAINQARAAAVAGKDPVQMRVDALAVDDAALEKAAEEEAAAAEQQADEQRRA